MSLEIWGIGTAQPSQSIAQDRAAELTSQISGHDPEQTRRIAALYRKSGVRRRHATLLDRTDLLTRQGDSPGPTTGQRMEHYATAIRPLALEAASKALADAKVSPVHVSHLVTVSCTGFEAPGFDLALVSGLGLDPEIQRTHVGFMGCHGALNGLRVARAFGREPGAIVLVCAAELCSLHFRFGWDSELAVSNALFADGAAAVVGGMSREPALEEPPWRLEASGSFVMPDTAGEMGWRIGDHGFEMSLSPRIALHIGEGLRPWLEGWLAQRGLRVADVASWAVHPGGPRVVDAVEQALGLDRAATSESRDVLASCGNMSSPTILFILDRMRRRGSERPCVALAFGPGLAIEAALFR
jgi:predicted naringenin-chalcone synthase